VLTFAVQIVSISINLVLTLSISSLFELSVVVDDVSSSEQTVGSG
jgi:hypothetical protein